MAEWDVVNREPDSPAATPQGGSENPWAPVSREPVGRRGFSGWLDDTNTRMEQTLRNMAGGAAGAPVNLVNMLNWIPRGAADTWAGFDRAIGVPEESSIGARISDALAGAMPALQQPEVVQRFREGIAGQNEQAQLELSPQAQLDAAGFEDTEGFLDAVGYLAQRPGMATQEAVGQLPQMAAAVPGRLMATIMAQGLNIGGQAEQQVVAEAQQRGMTDQEAAEAGARAFTYSAPSAGIGGLIPGGLLVERTIAGQLGRGAARGVAGRAGRATGNVAGEFVSEAGQEGYESVAADSAIGDEIDWQAARRDAGMGGTIGALTAGPISVADAMMAPSSQVDPAMIEELAAEIERAQAPPQQNPLSAAIADVMSGRQAPMPPPAAPRQAPAEPGLSEQLEQFAPREPALPQVPEGATREQLVSEWEAARSPDEKAVAAARIMAFDQQQEEGNAEATPVSAVPEGAQESEGRGGQAGPQDGRAGEPAPQSAVNREALGRPAPTPGQTGYVPAGTERRARDSVDKAYLKGVIDQLPDPTPEQLPDEPSLYFNVGRADDIVPVGQIIPSKKQRAGATAMRRMAASADGAIPRRDPIDVRDNGDGTYTIIDGNGSHAAAEAAGHASLPVRIVEAPAGREGWRRPRGLLEQDQSDSLTRMYEAAASSKQGFDDGLSGIASGLGGRVMLADLKGRTRAEEKIASDYAGDASKLKDVLRGSIVLKGSPDVAAVERQLSGIGRIVSTKNALDPSQPTPYWGGYRDAKFIIDVGGVLAEVQLLTEEFEAAKEKAHADYEIARNEAAREAEATGADRADAARRKYEAIQRMSVTYAPATDAFLAASARSSRQTGSPTRTRPEDPNARDDSSSERTRGAGSYTTGQLAEGPDTPAGRGTGTSATGRVPSSPSTKNSEPGGGSAGRNGSSGTTSSSKGGVDSPTEIVASRAHGVQSDTALIEQAIGAAATGIEVFASPSDLSLPDQRRLGITPEDYADIEGVYDPDTGTSYVFSDNIAATGTQSRADRLIWVAAHERLGHAGLRGLITWLEGSNAAGARAMAAMLRRAENNPTIRGIVDGMAGDRPEGRQRLVEEAIVEVAAAVHANDFAPLQERYGVSVTGPQQGTLRSFIERLVSALRRALGLSESMPDSELYSLIEAARQFAETGEVRGTSARSEAQAGIRENRAAVASRVGTRNPTGVRATESGADPDTVVGYDSFRADPKAFERNMDLVSQYPGIRPSRAGPARRAELFIGHVVDNLNALYDAMDPEFRERSKVWYEGANRAARELSSKYGVTDVQAAGTIAALSPQKDWFQNLSLAERVIDGHVNQNDRAWDPAMTQTADNIFGGDQYADLRERVDGRRLSELQDPVERAAWIRIYDQTHNDSAFPITAPNGDLIGTQTTAAGRPSRIQWGSLAEIAKGISMLQDGSQENVSRLLGRMHKIRSFYNNIIEPNSDRGDVTIDTHAVAAALMRPLSAASVEVGHNFGTGTSNSSITGNQGTYGLYAEAYRRAAASRGILPREMQSITWEGVRALFLPPSRRPNSSAVRDTTQVWNDYEKRRIDHGEAFQRSVDAGGGIRQPDWLGSAARLDEGEWTGAFRPAVSGAGVPGGRAQPAAARDGDSGRAEPVASRRPSDPLPGSPRVRGATGPDMRLVEVAEAYAREHGIDFTRQPEYVAADPERGRRIAEAYEAMGHAPQDPRVRRAYADLIEQTTAQYRALEAAGYRFYFDTTGSNPWDAMRQLRRDQTMGVYPTDEGFGSGATDIDVSDNPLMADTGLRWPDGSLDGELRPVLANDLFRAVHDAFGHGLEGAGFRADGEENAWQAHVRLFTGDAVGALTSETRGQNSWLNFGPYGETNRTASVEDTVFADQKTGLMPEWTWTEGRADEAPVASRRPSFNAKPKQRDAVSADAYHYSTTPGLTELDPTMAGTGGAGRERRAFGMGRFGERGGISARVNFYVRERGQPVPEPEDVVRGAGGTNLYRVRLTNLYDIDADPRGIAEEAGINLTMRDEMVAEAGFDGIYAGAQSGIDTPVAVVFDIEGNIPVQNVDGSEPIQTDVVPEYDDPNEWLAAYEARRRPVASRRTGADAMKDRMKNMRRLSNAYVPPPRGPVGFQQSESAWTGFAGARKEARDRLQDRMLALRDVQTDIESQTGEALDDAYNAYRIENLMRDRAGDMMSQVERKHLKPLLDLLRKNKVSVRKLEGYLLARATPEINAKIAGIRGSMPDGGSGLLTDQANRILAGTEPEPYTGETITPAEMRVMREAAKIVDNLRKWTLDTRQAQGLMSKEQRAALDRQEFYVPARGWLGEEDQLTLSPTGRRAGTLTSRSSGVQRAFGRGEGNLPTDIIANMVDDAQHAAWDSSVAQMKVAIMRLALKYPNPDVWQVEPVDMEWRLGADGQAYMGVKNSAMDAKNSVMVPYDGKFYRVRIEDPYLQRALLDSASANLGPILRTLAFINRWQASVFTRFNPLFPIVALARGAGFGATYVAQKHGAAVTAEAVIGFPKAVRGVWIDDRDPGDSSVPDAQKSWVDWAREARENGAQITVAQMAGVRETARDITRELQTVHEMWASGDRAAAVRAAGRRAIRPLAGVIEDVNNAMENGFRLSTYVALRKQGVSPQEAAETYKDMMTNFRRRGRLTEELGAVWLFFNPAMQGAHAFMKVARDPKFQAALHTLGALQAVAAWSLMGIDDDDDGVTAWDELEPWKKERSFIIPIGAITGDYRDNVFIPMEYGFNLFPYLYARTAQAVHDQMTGRERPGTHLVSDVAAVVAKSFSPIPFDEAGGVFGNFVSVLTSLSQNKDDLGRPITQGEHFFREGMPRSSMGRPSTSPIFQGAATALNRIGGGDDYTAPYILPQITDVSPQEIEYMLSQITGGIGNAVTQVDRMARGLSAGVYKDKMDVVSATPVVRSFVGRGNKRMAVANEFYDQANYMMREVDRFRDAFARGDYVDDEDAIEQFNRLRDEFGPVLAGIELDTYVDNTQNRNRGRAGAIKVDHNGRPRLTRSANTILGELEGYDYFFHSGGRNVRRRQVGAMQRVREINRNIAALRARDLTYRQMREMHVPGTSGNDPDAKVGSADRLRAITDLQERRMKIQQRWLKGVKELREEGQ